MVQGWVTVLLLAFGIVVAVIGVIAFLRLNSKDRLASEPTDAVGVGPSPRKSADEWEGAEEVATTYEQSPPSD